MNTQITCTQLATHNTQSPARAPCRSLVVSMSRRNRILGWTVLSLESPLPFQSTTQAPRAVTLHLLVVDPPSNRPTPHR
eukprot:648982-Prorocentrum_minimum.AAC.1